MSNSTPPDLLSQPLNTTPAPMTAAQAVASVMEEERLMLPQEPAAPTPAAPGFLSAREAMDSLAQEQQTQFFDALRTAASTDPNVYAEHTRLSRELGLSPEAAALDTKYLTRLAQAVRVREMPLQRTAPLLYERMQDVHFAKLAQDDVDTLSLGERIAKGFNIGQMQAERGKLTMMDRRGSLDPSEQLYAAQIEGKLRDAGNPTGFLYLPEMAKIVGQWAETIPQAVRAGAEAGLTAASVTAAASAVVPPAEAVTVPTAFFTAFGVTAATELGMQTFEVEAGNAYRDMIAAGYDPQRSAWAADAVGVVNMGLELGAASFVTKPIRSGIMQLVRQRVTSELLKDGGGRLLLEFVKDYAKAQGAEIGTETLQEVSNILGEWAASKDGQANPISEGEVVDRLTAVALDTAKGMALLSLPGPVMNARTNMARAKAAKEVQAWAKQMAALPDASKTYQRDPQSVAGIIQQAAEDGGNGTLYVDAKALGEMLRQQDKTSADAGKLEKSAADQVESVVPGLGAKLVEAEKVGGDVTLTTGEFTQLAGQSRPIADAMTDLLRTDPEGVAPRDADAVEKESQTILDAYAEEIAASVATGGNAEVAAAGVQGEQKAAQGIQASAKRASARAQRESRTAIREGIRKQIDATGTVPPSQSNAQAEAVAAFYEVTARKHGLTPEAVAKLAPLNIRLGTVSEQAAATLRQEGKEAPRAAYDPRTWTLMLFQRQDGSKLADSTSFLHESGHFFMHATQSLAMAEGATDSMRQEWADLLAAAGVKDGATWDAMDEAQRRVVSERFAYGFEEYLARGEAPSQQLKSSYDRFRTWFARVYRTVRDKIAALFLQETGTELPILTPELRNFFDRMLAVESAVEIAAAEREQALLFMDEKARKLAGVTDEQWASLQEFDRLSKDEAKAELTAKALAGLERFENSQNAAVREMAKKAKAKRAEVRKEAEQEVAQQAVYRAIDWIKTGEVTDTEGNTQNAKLDTDAVRRILGDDSLPAGMTRKGGLSPDVVAERFGWATGADMLQAILAAPPLAQAVDMRTDDRMATEFGDLTDPKKVRRAIMEALHGEARGKLLANELQALMRATAPTRVMIGAAKDAAKQVVRSMPVGQIDVRSFMAAEARAAKEATASLADGDVAKAIDAKRRHLLRHYMTLEAVRVEDRVEKFLDQVDTYFESDTEIAKKRDLDKVTALRAILAEFGLATGRQQQKAAEYMRILEREDPAAAARLQPRVNDATAEAKPYRDATWDAFQVMANEVEALWYEAKRGQEFHTFDGTVLRLVDAQEQLKAQGEKTLGAKGMAFGEEPSTWSLATVKAGLSRIEHYVRMLDGGDGGPWHRFVYRQVANAYTAYQARSLTEQTWWRDTVAQFDNLHGEKINAEQWLGSGVIFRDREHLLGAVYQSGNESNLRNMVLGWGWGEQRADGTLVSNWWQFMDEMQVKGILTEKDYKLLQSMWDRNAGELRSLMQRTNKKLFGTYVTEIQGTPFQTRWGMFKGGYAPSKVDMDHPKNKSLGTAKAFDGLAQGEMDFRAQFASVPRGMTIERKSNVVRPRILSLELQGSHLDEQLRFIFVQPAISDVARLFKRGPLVDYMNQAAPQFLTGLLAPAIERVARNSLTKPGDGGWVDMTARFLRRTTSLAALGFSVRNWLQQYTGVANVVPYVGVGHAWNAFWGYRGASGQSTALAMTKSPFMAVTLDENMAKVQEDLRQLFEPSGMGKAREWVNHYAYFLQRMADFQVKVISWNAAYSRALEDIGSTMTPEKADAEAVQRADSVVRRSQGSRNPFDAPNYATQTALLQLFTQFSEYPNLVLNQIMLAKDKREMAAAVMMALLVPTLVSGAITLALSGGRAPGSKTNDGDDDRDGRLDDEWAAYLFGQTIKSAGSLLPVIGTALSTALTETNADDRFTAAPAISSVQAFMRVVGGNLFPAWDDERRMRQQSMPGGAFTPQDARDASLVLGALLGIPAGPVGRAWAYWENVDAGKAEADSAFQVLRGMLNGR